MSNQQNDAPLDLDAIEARLQEAIWNDEFNVTAATTAIFNYTPALLAEIRRLRERVKESAVVGMDRASGPDRAFRVTHADDGIEVESVPLDGSTNAP